MKARCLDCPQLVPRGTRRCKPCAGRHDRARGTTTQRGYGHPHQQERERMRPLVEFGQATCWRCGQPIAPGARWNAGHDDHDRTRYRGPEHEACNLATNSAERRARVGGDPQEGVGGLPAGEGSGRRAGFRPPDDHGEC